MLKIGPEHKNGSFYIPIGGFLKKSILKIFFLEKCSKFFEISTFSRNVHCFTDPLTKVSESASSPSQQCFQLINFFFDRFGWFFVPAVTSTTGWTHPTDIRASGTTLGEIAQVRIMKSTKEVCCVDRGDNPSVVWVFWIWSVYSLSRARGMAGNVIIRCSRVFWLRTFGLGAPPSDFTSLRVGWIGYLVWFPGLEGRVLFSVRSGGRPRPKF